MYCLKTNVLNVCFVVYVFLCCFCFANLEVAQRGANHWHHALQLSAVGALGDSRALYNGVLQTCAACLELNGA